MSKKEGKTKNKTPHDEHSKEQVENTVKAKAVDEVEAADSKNETPPAESPDELVKKCAALQEQYLRKSADFENYRKRMIREKQDAIEYANTNLLLDLLEIIDGFDRAIEAAGTPEPDSPLASFEQGVLMIRDQMVGMLGSKYGLEYVPAQGEVFDPNIHEAVATTQSLDVSQPQVGEELQKGYRLRQRMIRHAKVMVLMPVNKESTEKNEEEIKS